MRLKLGISGLAPRIMGIGPTYAIPKVLEFTGLSINDVDLFEVNPLLFLIDRALMSTGRLMKPLHPCMSTVFVNSD